ncbi:MAG: hypothetical protein LBM02_08140 [Lachnospiraceae bacterium]|nr:hypothetical protein [Lachnospiraceae bacterium]
MLATKTEKILHSNLSPKEKWEEIDKRTRYYCEPREDRRMKDKLSIADNLMDKLNIKENMKKQIKYMITSEFKNFKELSKNCSNEQIIALMIFYVMKSHNYNLIIEKYKTFTELKLTNKHYMTFTTKLCRYYQNKIPVNIEI